MRGREKDVQEKTWASLCLEEKKKRQIHWKNQKREITCSGKTRLSLKEQACRHTQRHREMFKGQYSTERIRLIS